MQLAPINQLKTKHHAYFLRIRPDASGTQNETAEIYFCIQPIAVFDGAWPCAPVVLPVSYFVCRRGLAAG
jgi:hypothetical protein